MNQNLQKALLNEVRLLLSPVTAFAGDSRYRRIALENMGWNLDTTIENITAEPISLLAGMGDDLKKLDHLASQPLNTFSDFLQLLETTEKLFSIILKLPNTMEQLIVQDSTPFESFSKDLVRYLIKR